VTTAASAPPTSTVHLLMVHGVGGHDHLSNLLRTYQSFRANLQSVEAPITGEDQIPGWRLTQFDEGSTPPVLRLEPRVPPPPGGVAAVCMYEVNYSSFAGVVRHNHRLDLTGLFVGLDLAVCSASQRTRPERDPIFGAQTADVARCLQRTAGVFTAGTVPIIGLPALLFRNYIGTLVALFTRFFEDIATFVLDKNGEQLISAHLDRTLATIDTRMNPGDRLVIAAHSLGSVVVHNYVVRQWTTGTARLPDTVMTFGLGGPTKRITVSLIREMRPGVVSIPYGLREAIRGAFSAAGDVDPMAPSPSYAARLLHNVVSFAPTLAVMMLPIWVVRLSGQPVAWPSSWGDLLSLRALGALALFMVYVIACAAFEVVRTWHRLVTLFR